MSKPNEDRKIAGEVDHIERHYLVGRDREVRLFLERLNSDAQEGRILNVYGTGGIGKSYLLDEFRRLSEQARIPFVLMDSSIFSGDPHAFCLHLLQLLREPAPRNGDMEADIRLLKEACVNAIRSLADRGKAVLAWDAFEEAAEMENWLRDEFLADLSTNIVAVISGRLPLRGEWLSSPAWRRLVLRVPLGELDYDAVKRYLGRSGIEREEEVRHIWSRTKGHPLTLSLFASTTLAQAAQSSEKMTNEEIFPYIVKTWLKEVPDDETRKLVEAAAVLRHFNQELLSVILDQEVPTERFLKMIEHSFIRRVDCGWQLHDMLREAVIHELRLRSPAYYDRLWKRCIMHYYVLMKQSIHKKSAAWAGTDWVYYTGDRLIRTLFYQHSVSYRLEPLQPSNWAEAERYIEYRRRFARNVRIEQTDPETNDRFEFEISAEEGILGLKHLHLQSLYELDKGIVKLIRDPDDRVCGMAMAVPIHERTLDYLLSEPPSMAYFSSLPDSRLQELRTPQGMNAGYFVAFIDVLDYGDVAMRQAAGLTFIAYMLSAGLIVTTSPVIPFFHEIFQSLGLEKVKDVFHFDYEDQRPTPFFLLDTRGNNIHDYLNKMAASFDLAQDKDDVEVLLSKRERDVVERLIKGRSNLEIAEELCLSEATVKKHVSNVFKKFQVKNRVQLMNKYVR